MSPGEVDIKIPLEMPEPEGVAGNVIEALARCVRDVRSVGKDGRNTEQKYNFRGVDAVVNAAHPVFAKHRVVITPYAAVPNYTPTTSKSGTAGRFCDLKLTYRVYGPGGVADHIDVTVHGESADYGDKATAKAFSVAYRIALLQLLSLPTDDPDPDEGAAFEYVTQRAAQSAAVPDLPEEVATAREAVRGAWAFLYGGFNQREAEAAYTTWNGGGALVEADGPQLRKFAAYLSTLPASEAGSDPADMPPPDEPAGATIRRNQGESVDNVKRMTPGQQGKIFAGMADLGLKDKADQLEWISNCLGRVLKSRSEINGADARVLIDILEGKASGPALPGGAK